MFQAIEQLQNALDLSPQTVTYMELGRVHLLKKDVSSALTVYKDAVKYNSHNIVVLLMYLLCTSHSPEDPELLATLGLLYLEEGQPQKAFESLGSALTYDPSNNKVCKIFRGSYG